MTKGKRRLLSLILGLVMLIPGAVFSGGVAFAEEAKVVGELLELREASSKTYELSDGTYQFVGYAEDIHYQDEKGELADIKTELIDTDYKHGDSVYKYKNAAHSFDLYFADAVQGGYPVLLDAGGYTVALGFQKGSDAKANRVNNLPKEHEINAFIEENSFVTYEEVFAGVDMLYLTALISRLLWLSGRQERIIL